MPVEPGSVVNQSRVTRWKQSRFNPILGLDPAKLTQQLDDFKRGYLRPFAMTQDAISNRDYKLVAVIPKRILDVSRYQWSVLEVDGSDEAEAAAHKQALEYFYGNVQCTSAIDQNLRGGFSTMIAQMMSAVGFKYSAHEILWRPSLQGVTALLNHVPLMWFENFTGKLQYIKNDGELYGIPLTDRNWMITVGIGLMEASAVAWMYKTLSLRDWLVYNERHGSPGIHGKTNASKGSKEWENMEDAVNKVATEFAVVTGMEEAIEKLSFSAEGQLPYPIMVEVMDRANSAIWRGADLSTMSAGAGAGQGASLQSDEGDLILQGDKSMIVETLNENIDRQVIRMMFGANVTPKAYVTINIPQRQDDSSELAKDQFLVSHGARISVREALERYGRSEASEDDDILTPQQQGMDSTGGFMGRNGARSGRLNLFGANIANESAEDRLLLVRAREELAFAQAQDLQPLRERLETILDISNEQAFELALRKLRGDLPAILGRMNQDPKSAEIIERSSVASLFNGIAEGVVNRPIDGNLRRAAEKRGVTRRAKSRLLV